MPVVTQFLGGSLRLPLQVLHGSTSVHQWLGAAQQPPSPPQCPIHPWRDQQGPSELAKLHYRVRGLYTGQ